MSRRYQRGVSLITAVFIITALAVLGALTSRYLILGSEETTNEWLAAQALYAAESGVHWSAYDLLHGSSGGVASNATVVAGRAWFSTQVSAVTIGPRTLYTITSIGTAGGSAGSPRTERRITVQFMP